MRRLALTAAARVLPPAAYAKLHCFSKLGYVPNLKAPRTFSERVLAKRVYDRNPLMPITADKYTLRQYVADSIGEQHLPKLYAVIESADQLDLTKLPSDYVMKGSHGSGWNRIVADADLEHPEAYRLVKDWLSKSFYYKRQEWAYKDLTPRVVFEENLAPSGAIDDYKVFVFSGVPRMIAVDRDRFTGHRRALYTPEWRKIEVEYAFPIIEEAIAAPEQLDELLDLAAQLAAPFDFARVDFYLLKDRVVVGEITHYPYGGVVRFNPRSFDYELGAVWGEGRPVSQAYLEP